MKKRVITLFTVVVGILCGCSGIDTETAVLNEKSTVQAISVTTNSNDYTYAVFKLAMEVWNDKLAAEFATSGSSGFGKTVQNLQSSAADCKIIEGKVNPTSNDISAIAKM
ncbi:MAG: hypothetical protein PUE12_05440 [Oscillospiraceae bacterium]|nr:hypothetical protein [Oscillospiraceae bacterium]